MINRLLGGPKLDDAQKARVPPGQYVTPKWPVLHYGSVPRTDLATWDFNVWGEVENPLSFTWDEFKQMPRKSVHCDIHCVTRWSRLDMDFSGVPIQHILERAQLKPSARFVLAHCEQGYTANLPLSVLDDEDVLLADEANGEPLQPEHGYPLRLVVPKRYFWKSAKWIRGLQFLPQDMLGFWERYGYNNNADPWKEERFSDGNG
jgi:DMSO/TMAO reductase YedYZ molybdopterin-dependent catalytic subunit